MKGTILIAGGLGFVGSHVVEKLREASGPEVLIYDILAGQNDKVGNISIMRGDVFDSSNLVKALQENDVSHVIHLVGLASIPDCRKNPDASFQLNVSSIQSMLEAMRQSGVENLVFPSTAVVYGANGHIKVSEDSKPNPTAVYGFHKLAAESLIKAYSEDYGFKSNILRLFNVYGDLEREQGVVSLFIKRAMERKPIVLEGGGQLRDFVHVDDVATAFIKSLDRMPSCSQVTNVGSGVGLSIKEIAGLVAQSFPEVKVYCESPRECEYSIYADISRMKNALGFDPMDPREGIPRFVKTCANSL